MTRKINGNNPARDKIVNQAAILRMIYYFGPIKRSEIAERLSLTLPTITGNVNSMIEEGLVRETDDGILIAGKRGRKPRLVEIVPTARYYAGAEIQDKWRAVSILDFKGTVVYESLDETRLDYRKSMESLSDMLCRGLKSLGLKIDDLYGAGIVAPGLASDESGILSASPGCNWYNKNIRADFRELSGYKGRITVENNACARGYGAGLFQRELIGDAETYAYLFVSHGIACPLVLNTSGHMGSVVGAGEAGHMILDPDGPKCTCGNKGCLQAYSSNLAILTSCRKVMEEGGAPVLRGIVKKERALKIKDVLDAQAAGDRDVRSIVESAVFRLGQALASINNFTCPKIVLIEGEIFENNENRQYLLDIVLRNVCDTIHADTKFVFVKPDRLGGAKGGAARAILKSIED